MVRGRAGHIYVVEDTWPRIHHSPGMLNIQGGMRISYEKTLKNFHKRNFMRNFPDETIAGVELVLIMLMKGGSFNGVFSFG